MEHDAVIVRYGEVFLKGDWVRRKFTDKLDANIRRRLESCGLEHTLKRLRHGLIIKPGSREILDSLQCVFGVKVLSPCMPSPPDLRLIADRAVEYARPLLCGGVSFAVRAKRHPNFPVNSMQIEVEVGRRLQEEYGNPVDLSRPDVTIYAEVMEDSAYIGSERISGPGGLPYGTQGRVLSIIEDEQGLAASYVMMKRGCSLEAVATADMGDGARMLEVFTDGDFKIHYGSLDEAKSMISKGLYHAVVSTADIEDAPRVSGLFPDTPVFFPLHGYRGDETRKILSLIRENSG